MLEERIPFLDAATILGVAPAAGEPPCDAKWAGDCQRRKSWRDVYARVARQFYEAKASDSNHSKKILVGRMLSASEALRQMGKPKEEVEALAQVAKTEGWVGSETTVNLFSELSGADFARLRASLAAKSAVKT